MPHELLTETGLNRRDPPRRWRNGSVVTDDTDPPECPPPVTEDRRETGRWPTGREREIRVLQNLWKIESVRTGPAR